MTKGCTVKKNGLNFIQMPEKECSTMEKQLLHSKPKSSRYPNSLWLLILMKDGEKIEAVVKNDILEIHDQLTNDQLSVRIRRRKGRMLKKTLLTGDVQSVNVLGTIGNKWTPKKLA